MDGSQYASTFVFWQNMSLSGFLSFLEIESVSLTTDHLSGISIVQFL